jgi:hypothetical protein
MITCNHLVWTEGISPVQKRINLSFDVLWFLLHSLLSYCQIMIIMIIIDLRGSLMDVGVPIASRLLSGRNLSNGRFSFWFVYTQDGGRSDTNRFSQKSVSDHRLPAICADRLALRKDHRVAHCWRSVSGAALRVCSKQSEHHWIWRFFWIRRSTNIYSYLEHFQKLFIRVV